MNDLAIIGQEYFTARELAEIARARGLTSFPSTERGVQLLAAREGWNDLPSPLARRRDGQKGGGGMEYHRKILPDIMQAALVSRVMVAAQSRDIALRKEAEARQMVAATSQGLPARGRQVMEARAAILVAIEGYAIVSAQTRAWGIARFLAAQTAFADRQEIEARRDRGEKLTPVEQSSLGKPLALTTAAGFHLDPALLAVANDRRKSAAIGRSTIYAWFKARDTSGVVALSPTPPHEAQPIPPAFGEFLKFYAIPTKPSAADAHREYLKAALAKDGVQYEPVTLGQAQNILRRRLNNIEKHVGREGILTLRARLPYIQRTTDDMWPTTIYTADGKTFDAEVADPVSRRPMRPEITSILDVATRKCVGFAISRKENVIAVAEALRRACSGHGIPAMFYVDRGTGYKNKTFDGGATMDIAVSGLLGRLGITKMHALPYNSQAKGIIERFNAHWNDLAKTLPSYIGEDMDKEAGALAHKVSRADIREFGSSSLLPSWDDFLAMCERKIAEYNDRPHKGLPRYEDPETRRLRHMTPNEAWATHVARGFAPIEIHAEDEDDLFRPYEVRTVRRALVEWNTNTYFHQDLERYHEMKVLVGYDQTQADRVWVREFDEDSGLPGKLICVATFGGNKQRYVPLTAEQAALEGRVKGQLRRLGRKVEAVQDQLRAPLIEHQPVIQMQTFESAPAPIPVRNEAPEERQKSAVIATDADLAKLCLADPGQLTEGRARILREAMSRRNARELLRISGVDLDELDDLLRSAA